MKRIAIITARGGSRRIPGKNIKDFCGKPILAYSIEAARQSACFDEVMVSTDSEEIADIARKYGALVPFMRSVRTSGDYAVTADVIAEVLTEYDRRGKRFDMFCCIYPTAPFVTAEMLAKAVEQYEASDADAVVAAVPYSFPPQRSFVIREGYVRYQYPENERARSQDLEPVYHDCGQFYLCSAEMFWRCHTLIMPRTIPFLMSENEVQDIDTEEDWKLAELKYIGKHYRERNGRDMIKQLLRETGGYDRRLTFPRIRGGHFAVHSAAAAAGKAGA